MPFYSNEEVLFSQMLRSARNQIECAFGRLKARWQILQRPLGIASNWQCLKFDIRSLCVKEFL